MRQRDLAKLIGRIQVVLSGLVNDAKQSESQGIWIRDHGVDLADLKGCGVTVVREAHDELAASVTG